MSIDPDVIRSEPHVEIGNLLERDVDIVLERWSRRAEAEQPNAKRVHHSVLLDHLRELLQALGRSLAESETSHTKAHRGPALVHGKQRWEAGWSLPEVVRDYQILRLVIFELLEEALDTPLESREVLAIGLALDEAITDSVVKYVKARDEHLNALEKKRAEKDREIQQRLQKQAEALQDADRRKNEFLAFLGHELRNPLGPLRTAAQILGLKGAPDPEVKWVREVIDRQVQHMTRMVDDLLDVSRITSGKVKIEKEPVQVGAVVDRALEMVRPLIDARKHELTIALPAEPQWLQADPTRLAQVLANLLDNAAKYTDEGGQIWLTAQVDADELVVKVRDTGVGIPSEVLPRVFDAFTQEERSLNRTHDGLGLGLTLVRKLVELHGGGVKAFSAGRGKGSEFVLHLPILMKTPPSTVPVKRRDGQDLGRSRRILVVDDHIDGANSLAMLLRLSSHEVHTAHDGPTALEIVRTNPPEVILLDIGLPHMDGLEVARRVRQELGLTSVLLIAMTGYGEDQDRRRSMNAGFNAHLVKPVAVSELQDLLAGGVRATPHVGSPDATT